MCTQPYRDIVIRHIVRYPLFYVLNIVDSSGLHFFANSRLLNCTEIYISLMLAMLVVATALLRFGFVNSRASNEDQFDSEHISKIFSEDDMTPDFTEQLGSHDHTRDIKKRNDATRHEKYGPPQNEVKTALKYANEIPEKNLTSRHSPEAKAPGRHAPIQNAPEDGDKRLHNTAHEEIDVVDREDHVTQYLSDQLVNTDSEITGLQASESEDEQGDSVEVKEDWFFAFLTGQQKAVEVEGAWSRPVVDDLQVPRVPDQQVNVITDVE